MGRARTGLSVTGIGLLSALSVAAGSLAAGPTSEAGATTPASLNCGTLEISGTDSHTYQFSEFTTGNASRSNSNAGGSVAYGGTLTASNWTTANSIPPRRANSRPWWVATRPAS